MNRYRFHIALFACALMLALMSLAAAQPGSGVVPGRYIVELKEGASPGKVIAAHGAKPDFVYTAVIKGFAGYVPPGRLRALERDPDVLSVAPDRVVRAIAKPEKPGKPDKNDKTPPQEIPAGIVRIGAAPVDAVWTGLGVGVAVVDTGLDFAHLDLPVAGSAYSFTAYGTSAQDDNGHGTHVGGIIAAKNNTIDVVGVAPDATLYAVKVLNSAGSGLDSTVLAGLDWVFANADTVSPPIRVVNMSLGRDGSLNDNPALRAATQNLYAVGIVIVTSAGNDPHLEVSQQVPATYPEVLAIASTTAVNGASRYRALPSGIVADTASYFTTDGAFDFASGIGVTISAPGEQQEDLNPAGMIQSVGILSTKMGGGTVRMSGTSMAAPHVSGVAARFFEANPDTVDVEILRALLMGNALKAGTAPYNSPTSSYSFDGQREGIVSVPELWLIP